MLGEGGDHAMRRVVTAPLRVASMFMLAAQFPFQPVDDAFDAGLKDIGGDADGSPPVCAVGKKHQHPHQGAGPALPGPRPFAATSSSSPNISIKTVASVTLRSVSGAWKST